MKKTLIGLRAKFAKEMWEPKLNAEIDTCHD